MHRLYFEPSSRPSKAESSFIGLYRNKCIEQLASIETVVVDGDRPEDYSAERGELTNEERERIMGAINDFPDLVNNKHRYYLLDELFNTNFVKSSKGGMRSNRNFHLSKWLTYDREKTHYSAQQVAERLMNKKWEEATY